ncbi:electron transport complex subunit RsxC [Candidatus Desantisbacteria bacterium CG_4_10_14_0_8_um_filter_48_22]|uniref:Ion-translocating oxidoreductase complex subunit C n=1 Tax=Candidatus Desantisbacteria bacterium CG_4_10_14_0_8_um_filter_48_22 TaxID=1974543 RepID=A0A2M7S7F8_9BACT|nr:MAG: hypothetical protein AUJ67_05840 [Candidatus Desantisbacteria bacterium CG1_02_49_89]PIV55330.1 MAG: electron transport complex subunit RsxC [Candidatus Desantisbacteria bacterium CG02_land_8_20_14_3_00_49_13]PIZ15446.1 MAG: electron transport complex subunit RsxC [Candidatus Desantisbacteria bacterium CG_4_10_14_0_8_um_filter_48_22]
MNLKTFPGGIHPPESKHFTERKPIEDMPVPSLVVIPLQQHTGAPCEPLVKPGDEVKEGQKIGDSKSFVSAPLHSSISGKVSAIEPRPHPVIPKDVLSIVIEANSPQSTDHGQETTASKPWTVDRGPSTELLTQLTPQQIKEKIREAGVVGLGGAAFPTHVKLSPPPEKKIDTVILNGCECEPYLTNDHQLMLEKPAEILEGLKIILKVLGINRAFIAIESNKLDAIEKLRTTHDPQGRRTTNNDIHLAPVKTKYPQGAEKQLIKAILNREVPGGGLPFDVGVIVQNVGTAFAIYEAVTSGKPLIERVVTVTGPGIKEPRNLRVRIGTPVSRVIEYCGGLIAGASSGPDFVGTFPKIIMGGPMMGIAQYTLDVPVIKGTSGILVLNDVKEEKEGPCIKCGRCVDICPMYLMPNRIGDYAGIDIFERCKELGIMDCMECGACAFVCASRRPLVHLIKYAKSRLAAAKKS